MDPNRQSETDVPKYVTSDSVGPNSKQVADEHKNMLLQRQSSRQGSLLPSMISEQPKSNLEDLDMSANTPFLAACIVLLNIPGFLIDYAQSYQNQLNPAFEAKFGWAKGHDTEWHIAVLGASPIFGIILGALSAGQLMKFGRRRMMFLGAIISAGGNGVSCYISNYWFPVLGRFLYGFGVGIYQAVLPKMIEEIVPAKYFSMVMGCFSFAKHSSSFVNFFLAIILPPDTDTEALKETNLWLVWYLYLPVSLTLIFFISLICIFRYEPIKFLIRQKKTDQAVKAVKQMYKGADTKEKALVYIQKIKSISGKASSGITLWEAMTKPQYRTATWINFVYVIFHELAGNSIINMYSNTIFKQMDKNGKAFVTPRTGTMIVGFVAFFSSLFSTQLVRCFGRKTLLLWGHAGIAIFHAGIAIFNMEGIDEGVLFGALAFTVAYQFTTGPVTYIYATETTVDAALGIIFPALFGTIFVLSLITPIIIDPDALGPNGTFLMLSGLSILAFIYVLVFMKETFGKSDKEKKLIHCPQWYLDQSQSQASEQAQGLIKD